MDFYVKMSKIKPKWDKQHKQIYAVETPSANSNPQQKEYNWRYYPDWFQFILQRHSNANSMVLDKNRLVHQQNRIENWDLTTTAAWLFWRHSLKIHIVAKDNIFNKRFWEHWVLTCGRMKLDKPLYCLSPCTKINSKWIKQKTCQSETVRGNSVHTKRQAQVRFFWVERTSFSEEIWSIIDKWDNIKLQVSKEQRKL